MSGKSNSGKQDTPTIQIISPNGESENVLNSKEEEKSGEIRT